MVAMLRINQRAVNKKLLKQYIGKLSGLIHETIMINVRNWCYKNKILFI